MKKFFICSIICGLGIVGGAIYMQEHLITYRTNKLTVDRRLRNLELPLNKITSLTWKWFILPIATFTMENGETYQFIIFNKWRFDNWFNKFKDVTKD